MSQADVAPELGQASRHPAAGDGGGSGAGRGAGQVLGDPGPSRSPSHRTSDPPDAEGYGGAGGLLGSGKAEVRRRGAGRSALPVFIIALVMKDSCRRKTAAPNPLASLSLCPSVPTTSLWENVSLQARRSGPPGRMRLDPETNQPTGIYCCRRAHRLFEVEPILSSKGSALVHLLSTYCVPCQLLHHMLRLKGINTSLPKTHLRHQ